jgi:dynein heavy chain
MAALRTKQAELATVLAMLAALDADLAEKVARKESLEAEVELCKVKLDRCVDVRVLLLFEFVHAYRPARYLQMQTKCTTWRRAHKLIAGLSGEKSRWTAAAARLGQEFTQLTGDVLLAAAQVAYLGAFTSSYRSECLTAWVAACQARSVPCSERFRLAAVLGDPVKVRLACVSLARSS